MMKQKVFAVYFAGLLQGLTLVLFPAASLIFTGNHYFHLSDTEYGALFIPQALVSIAASLLSAKVISLKGIKWVFLFGLIANLVAMLLFALSSWIMKIPLAYGVLLISTTSLGLGFGLMVPTLNTLASGLFLKKMGTALLILNAFLGVGTALAPFLITLFLGFGIWWGLPLLLVFVILGLLFFSLGLMFKEEKKTVGAKNGKLPGHFWFFAVFILLYGMIETVNGNWATTYMKNNLQVSAEVASLALTFFWLMVTVGRIFFAVMSRFFSEKYIFQILPFIVACAFFFSSFLQVGSGFLGILVFAVAGFGCSALLPLTISFANKAFPFMTSRVEGSLVAFYLIGYGLAAFGLGPLQGIMDISKIFYFFSVVALILTGGAFIITGFKRL